jgi:phosphatidate cytidylyltransferase
MSEFLQRSLTAIGFTVIILSCIILGKITFILLFMAIMGGCLWEFYLLFRGSENPPMIFRGFILAGCLFLFSVLYALGFIKLPFFSLLVPLLFILPISTLFIPRKETILSSALTLWGLFYCVIPICLFVWIGFIDHHHYGYHLILGPLFFIWFNDTGAYIFGKIFGRRRMFEKISPGKTWGGFFGGALSALALAYFLGPVFPDLNQWQWMALSLIVVCSGTLGDLVESLYKRELKIKDSGKFFPGHGGMLDRFDSFLMSAPFVYIFLLLIKS